ncbi:Alkaline serine protease AorO [Mycena sanguinolenta]|uniref:Alkaline serine protease AorO n=1 Tax=Mycena sanguinolenta TaxID=230812 RepID=A0A8H6ZFQ9_9AGAR|nr:Alkaline serine protease AorO [Mycena sanguinolenta]
MFLRRVFLAALGVFSICSNALAREGVEYVVHERRTTPARRWHKRDRVPGDHRLSMTFALAQPNLAHGHDLLMEISDPDSPRYGQHFTHAEIAALFAPGDDAIAAVREWLHSFDVHPERISISPDKTRIQVNSFVSEAEYLLRTEYYHYEHSDTGMINIASETYHLPTTIQRLIDFVTPGAALIGGGKARVDASRDGLDRRHFAAPGLPVIKDLPKNITKLLASKALKYCDKYITPPCIKAMYNITDTDFPDGNPPVDPNNRLGIFEFGDFYSEASLTQFFAAFGALQYPPIVPAEKPDYFSIDGALDPIFLGVPFVGTESDLDLQISYPIIWPQRVNLYQSDDDEYTLGLDTSSWKGNGFINNFLNAIDGSYCESRTDVEKAADPQYPHNVQPLGYTNNTQCGTLDPPYVISFSYGEQEVDLPESYQKRQCDEFMKLASFSHREILVWPLEELVLGMRTGVWEAETWREKVFNPDYPATCPYVTSVGATYLPPKANYTSDAEVAVTSFPSGGGFSNIYGIPEYQKDAVAAYLGYLSSQPSPYPFYGNDSAEFGTGIYNRSGRGYPDVSAVGDNIVIVADERPTMVGGTSASAPVFAAILTRINEVLLSQGKKPVGFVNPILYKNPHAFHDITVGTNAGCGTQGFSATHGWDPLTGLGTPNYPKLLKVFCDAQGGC